MERYALYFAPAPDSDLGQFGAAWLGRDAFSGEAVPRDDLDDEAPLQGYRLDEITRSPRHYGFHATLKAPFALAPGSSRAELIEALDAFAARTKAFEAPALELASLHGFTAFILSAPCADMDALAAACVRDFDRFRAPMTEADRARRQPERLTDRQRAQLDAWGYPHVFEDFLFHMTLSERLSDPEEIAAVHEMLEPVASVFGTTGLSVDALCLFHQRDRDAPFTVAHRAPLA